MAPLDQKKKFVSDLDKNKVSGSLTQSLSKIRDKNFFFEIEGSSLWIKKKKILTLILMKLKIFNLYSLGILHTKFYQNHRQKVF